MCINQGGYNALMLLSACMGEVDVATHSEIVSILIVRSGVNALAKKVRFIKETE